MSETRVRMDRFGQPVEPGATLKPRPHDTVRRCNRCRAVVAVCEIPAGYLDDPAFAPYVCGECLEKGTA